MKIGVLALQGAFAEHVATLERIGVTAVEIRQRSDLADGLAGVIIPGGESTVIGKLLVDLKMAEPLRAAIESGMPVFGTCAGVIVLAREVEGLARPHIPVLGVRVRRNAYGRQLESFSGNASFAGEEIPMVFIRAPIIEKALEDDVAVLARVEGAPVAVRQGNVLATSFHPELTASTTVHRYFADMAREYLDTPLMSATRCVHA